MDSSEELFARALKLIPGGVNSPVRAFRSVGGSPFFVKAANGAILTTQDGRDLIDFVCTWGPAIHGHNHPRIREAIAGALANGTSFGTPNAYEVRMAELIHRLVPSIEKVRMCSSGTEATMSAVRLARGFTGRDKIIKFAGCYHGHSDSLLVKAGSGALTHGHPDSAGVPAAFARETIVVPFNDPAALDAAFAANAGLVAAVIIEPYPANVGLILPEHGFLAHLRRACTANGALLIFDEVMTGFRLALGGVQEIEKIVPDLTALGKIIGGGLPVYQAGTLSGNPLAMAAGIAALEILDEDPPYARLDELGRKIATALLGACRRKGIAAQVPQTGSMFCIFFTDGRVRNYEGALRGDAALFARFFRGCLDLGVYLPPSAYETAFISTAHEGKSVDRACEVMAEVIGKL
jgi:glutamate-1-semialdehyde 2,1-aminomutase